MKKIVLLIVLSLVILSPAYAEADRSYTIDAFQADAVLNTDGSMDVTETLTYNFSGEFNGVYRALSTAGSDGIENIEIFSGDNGTPIMKSDTGSNNTYEIIRHSDGPQLKIFSKSKDEVKKFIIKYKVLNVAVRYRDIAELYWKFMGHDTDVMIRNFRVNITLPPGASKNEINAFAHGPLSGVVEIIDGQNIALTLDELNPNTFVEARVLFPPSLVKDSYNALDKNALRDILDEERRWAEEANAKRRRARAAIFISFVYAFIELLLICFIYFKYDKEYKSSFKGKYYRELPGNYSPAVMSVLWNFGRINPRDITATLMDLVRRKYITLNTEVNRKKGVFGKKSDTDYVFTLNEGTDASKLSKHEAFFIDWIFNNIGSNNHVSLDDIEDYTKTKQGAVDFKSNYDAWAEVVKQESEEYGFFDKSSHYGIWIGVLASLLGIALAVFTMMAHGNVPGFFLTLFTSMILLIYSVTVKRRSPYGVLQFQMWKAFRKFLLHFSRLDKAELPSVILWEHYLVYAITLGVAKEVIRQLKLVFREEDFHNSSLTYMYYGYYGYRLNHFDALSNVTNAVTKATESTYKVAVSKTSSSSGRGGGFSGGGGGGGGGGGAGAF